MFSSKTSVGCLRVKCYIYKKNIKKCNKIIGSIKRSSENIPHNCLLKMYKYFIRPHLNYVKPKCDNFQNKMKKFQYRASLAITGGIQGTSREQLYDELGLYSLVKRRWRNKLVFFIKL